SSSGSEPRSGAGSRGRTPFCAPPRRRGGRRAPAPGRLRSARTRSPFAPRRRARTLAPAVGGEPSYERLSAQDASFIQFENAGSPAHITAVAVFDSGGRIAEANGALDMDLVRAHVPSRPHLLPHCPQRPPPAPPPGPARWGGHQAVDIPRPRPPPRPPPPARDPRA